MIEQSSTAAKAAATVGIGAAGTSYTYLGLPMSDLVGLITIVYLLVQTARTLAPLVTDLRCWLKRRRK